MRCDGGHHDAKYREFQQQCQEKKQKCNDGPKGDSLLETIGKARDLMQNNPALMACPGMCMGSPMMTLASPLALKVGGKFLEEVGELLQNPCFGKDLNKLGKKMEDSGEDMQDMAKRTGKQLKPCKAMQCD